MTTKKTKSILNDPISILCFIKHTHTHVYVKYIVTKKNIRLNFVIFISIELYCPALLAV